MTGMQRVSLMLRVLMEIGVVIALLYWGIHTGNGPAAKIALGIGAPAVGFGLWGAVDFHRSRMAEQLRLTEELVISGLAAVAWFAAGQHILGIALGALSIGYHVLVYLSGERLLRPRNERTDGRPDKLAPAAVSSAGRSSPAGAGRTIAKSSRRARP
jgi:Protein of unknown function (DUF2568)